MSKQSNKYPAGKLGPDDEGSLDIAIGIESNRVVIRFFKQVVWVGLLPSQARDMANSLIKYADRLEMGTH